MVVTLVILIALVSIAALIATWMIGKKYEDKSKNGCVKIMQRLEMNWNVLGNMKKRR